MDYKDQAPAEGWQGAEKHNKDTDFRADSQFKDLRFSLFDNDMKNSLNSMATEHYAGYLRVRTGNRRMSDAENLPIPKDLYHKLLYEGEMTILFADTGIGKSIFAFQIAVHISKHGNKVLYADLELSDKQFQARYSDNYKNPYVFPDTLHFADISVDASIPAGWNYDDYFIDSLIKEIEKTGTRIIVIDNMTKIVSTDTDKANTAKPLMDRLIELKRQYGLTLLLLEHTRKADMYRPISLNDLQGSKMKVNFADSVFTIGRSSKDANIRYVKQLKCRSTEIVYDAENVAVYQIKKENSFLHFEFIGYSGEYEHLKQPDENTIKERNTKIKELREKGVSNIEIGKQFGISEGAVRKILKKSGYN